MQIAGKRITKYGLALLLITLLGLFFRVYQLGTESLWVDEGWSVWASTMSVTQMVQVTRSDVHPPLYYFILHYWMMVFGTSESAVRLLSALFGVLAVPMIYAVGVELFDEEVGLVGALILALSSFNIWYSQETRMYSLMVLLALFSMYFFLRVLRQSTLASSAGYVLSTTLLVYTHTYSLFVLIAQNVYLLTLLLKSKNRAHLRRRWVKLQVIIFALFTPWMVVLIRQIPKREATISSLTPPTAATIVDTFLKYCGTGALLVLFLSCSVLSLFVYQKVRGSMDWKLPFKVLESYSWEVRIQVLPQVYFLAVWLLSINLIPFVISRFSAPIYVAKYTIAASASLYLLVAKGIGNINYRPIKFAVIGVVVVLLVANLQVYYGSITKPQAREATQFIDDNFKGGDLVLAFPAWQPFTFDYYNKRTDIAIKQIHSWATPSEKSRETLVKELQSEVTGHDRVWLYVASSPVEKAQENFTLSLLNESYGKINVKSYYGYDVYLFEKRA